MSCTIAMLKTYSKVNYHKTAFEGIFYKLSLDSFSFVEEGKVKKKTSGDFDLQAINKMDEYTLNCTDVSTHQYRYMFGVQLHLQLQLEWDKSSSLFACLFA